MTKSEVLEDWKAYRLPPILVSEQQLGYIDRVARREDWNNYTDLLCQDGQITPWQYENWTHPRIVDPD